MIVSGANREEIAGAITRELPFGLWSLDIEKGLLTGYNKFAELMDSKSSVMDLSEFKKLVRDDYQTIVGLAMGEIGESEELDLSFPTNERWLRLKLTHLDVDTKVGYGYLIECVFDNEKQSESSVMLNMMEKQNLIVQRLINYVENGQAENVTDLVLKDILASTGCDRVSVIEYDSSFQTQTCTHEVTGYGVEGRQNIVRGIPIDTVPWLSRAVAKNEIMFVYDKSALPVETLEMMNVLDFSGVKSLAVVPLYHREVVLGYMLLDFMSRSKHLEPSERDWLRSLGCFVEYSLDIASHESEHQGERDKMMSLVDNMPFGFLHLRLLYDTEHRPNDLMLLHVNRHGQEMIGRTGVDGKTASKVFGKEMHHILGVCAGVSNSGESRIVEDFFYMNGEMISAEVFMSGYSELMCILSRNLQSLYSPHQNLQKATREQLVSRELQHIIRTNLNAILGFAELLLNETNEHDKEKYMEIIKENAQSLLDSSYIKETMNPSESNQQSAAASQPEAQASGEKKCILIAEDTESNYMLVSYILKNDYELIWAHDGVEALEMYDAKKPDLILMDVRMPRLGGLTATSRIRETDKTTPIIALTAFAFESDKAKTLESGCNDFVSKPINAKALKEIVKRYIN